MASKEEKLARIKQLESEELAYQQTLKQQPQTQPPAGTDLLSALRPTQGLPLDTGTPLSDVVKVGLENIPELGGMVGGATLGSSMGAPLGPIGAVGGGILGAGMGAMTGEAVEQLGKRALDLPVPETSLEAATEIGKAGLIGAGGQALGGAITKGVSSASNAIANKMWGGLAKDVIPEAKAINKTLANYGTNLTTAQSTTTGWLDVVDNIYKNSMLTASKAGKVVTAQALASKDMVDEFTKQFVATSGRQGIKDIFATTFLKNKELKEGMVSKAFEGIDILTEGAAKVRLGGLVGTNRLASTDAGLMKSLRKLKIIPPSMTKKQFAEEGTQLLNKATFGQVARLKSDLQSKAASVQEKLAGRGKGSADYADQINLISKLDKQMEASANQYDLLIGNRVGRTTQQLKEARKLAKSNFDTFQNDFILSLDKAEPTRFAETVSRIKEVSQIKQIKNALGENSEAFQTIRGSYLKGKLLEASKVTPTLEQLGDLEVIGSSLKTILSIKKTDPEVLSSLLGKQGVKDLTHLNNVISLTQSKNANSMFVMAAQMQQSGAVMKMMDLTNSKAISTGLGVLMSPLGLGKLLSSKHGRNLILEGTKVNQTKGETLAWLSKVGATTAAREELTGAPEPKTIKNPNLPGARKKQSNFMDTLGGLSQSKPSKQGNIIQQLGQLKGVRQ